MMGAAEDPESQRLSRGRAAAPVEERPRPVVHSDPEITGGEPVFVGTRVPVDAMFDYLVAGDSLDRFLRHFPSVQRQQAIDALERSREALLDAVRARPL
jgi:uncharacterized protein (DUF433 family)